MTLSETKAKIRAARHLMRMWRERINRDWPKPTIQEIVLPREDFETLEWAMGHLLKQWIYDVDAEGEIIRETGRLVRINSLFTMNDGTDNFRFKGIPVRMAK